MPYVVVAETEPDHRGRPRGRRVDHRERPRGGSHGRQLHRIRTIGDQQDHLDPADLHRGQRTLPHRDRPAGRASHLHRPPAHLRTRLLATAGTHPRRPLPRRTPAPHDRHRRLLSTQHRRTRPLRPGRPQRRHQKPRPARRPARLDVAYIEKHPGPRPATAFTPAATLPAHPTALGRALLAFSPPAPSK